MSTIKALPSNSAMMTNDERVRIADTVDEFLSRASHQVSNIADIPCGNMSLAQAHGIYQEYVKVMNAHRNASLNVARILRILKTDSNS